MKRGFISSDHIIGFAWLSQEEYFEGSETI